MEKVQLSDEIAEKIYKEIRWGRYAQDHKLPPEVKVAQDMGVSRTLIRDSLMILEREGFISRKHGVGTVINRHVVDIRIRMDLEKEFLNMITEAGYTPETVFVTIERIRANEEISEKLKIAVGEEVFKVDRLITADKKPALYCEDYIALSLVKEENYDTEKLREPIFDFLKEFCHIEVYMDLTEVRAMLCDEELEKYLSVKPGAPILYLDEIGYDFYGTPVLYSKEYYPDSKLHHTILRKKI